MDGKRIVTVSRSGREFKPIASIAVAMCVADHLLSGGTWNLNRRPFATNARDHEVAEFDFPLPTDAFGDFRASHRSVFLAVLASCMVG